jgi:hypothetical protein
MQRRDRSEGLIAPRSPGLRPTSPGLAVPSLHDLPARPTSPGLGLLSPRVSAEFVRPPPQRSHTSPHMDAALDAGLTLRRVPSAQRL